jgi:2-polyprenyl-3-methyl-5-hydroxy-6-metoxy-1,4-benzoquinol methylase
MSFYAKIAVYYDRLFPFNQKAYTFLLEYIPESDGKILDIGCGTGQMCGKLSKSGNQVTAIDIDDEMLNIGRAKYPQVQFINLNMHNISKLDGKFDIIFSIGNVMSYLSKTSLQLFTENIFQLLNQEGIWIFQTVNWHKILKAGFVDFPILEVPEENVKFIREYKNITLDQVNFITKCTKDEQLVVSESATLYPITSNGFISAHEKTGFKLGAQYGDYLQNEFDKESSVANVMVFKR